MTGEQALSVVADALREYPKAFPNGTYGVVVDDLGTLARIIDRKLAEREAGGWDAWGEALRRARDKVSRGRESGQRAGQHTSESDSGSHPGPSPLSERFWSKVAMAGDDECWEWLAGHHSKGYGTFDIDNRSWRAHRVAWMLINGDDPGDSCVLHSCDNRNCVNPAHLFLGSNEDNVADHNTKGRQA